MNIRKNTALCFWCALALLVGCGREEKTEESAGELTAQEQEGYTIWTCQDHMDSNDVELDGWEHVTFVSYAPEQEADETSDAVFCLEKDGEILYQFPYVMRDNRRILQHFVRIPAVSIQDYDGDGDQDVIILVEYEPMTISEDPENLMEVRLYRNRPELKEFVLDTDRMSILNRNSWNCTIQEVMEHMEDVDHQILLNVLTDAIEE